MPETIVDPPQQLWTSVTQAVDRFPRSSVELTGKISMENPQVSDVSALNEVGASSERPDAEWRMDVIAVKITAQALETKTKTTRVIRTARIRRRRREPR